MKEENDLKRIEEKLDYLTEKIERIEKILSLSLIGSLAKIQKGDPEKLKNMIKKESKLTNPNDLKEHVQSQDSFSFELKKV